MILLEAIVEVAVGPMPHAGAKFAPDRLRIGIVAVRRDPVGDHSGDRLRRSKETLRRGEVTVLAEHDVDQGAVAIDRAIEVLPLAAHPNIRLVDVPCVDGPMGSRTSKRIQTAGR